MADPLKALKKKKYRDYAYILTLIARDETGSLLPWAEELVGQLRADDSNGFENTKSWINTTLGRTEWGLARTARQESGEIQFALGQTPEGRLDYEAGVEDKRIFIRDQAARLGAVMSDDEIDELARESRLEQYDDNTIVRMIRGSIAADVMAGEDLQGQAGDFQNSLNNWASQNGVQMNMDQSSKYIQDMVNGYRSLDDIKQELRETYLVGAFPAWADKIREGYDPSALAAPYVSTAERLLEVGSGSLGFDDPIIQQGMQATDASGSPRIMPLYEYERAVRSDPRWEFTNNAYSSYTKVGTDLLRMFGFR